MNRTVFLSTAVTLALGTLVPGAAAQASGAYDDYVGGALSCMAGAPGDAAAQDACVVAAVEECKARAGVYEACLHALRDGFDAAIARVEAQEMAVCGGQADSPCAVVLRGHALIRAGQGLDAAEWAGALTGAE